MSFHEDTYIRRRLAEVNRSSAIPAETRVTLALDGNLDNDALEQSVGTLDPEAPSGQIGWGLSEVMHHLLSSPGPLARRKSRAPGESD